MVSLYVMITFPSLTQRNHVYVMSYKTVSKLYVAHSFVYSRIFERMALHLYTLVMTTFVGLSIIFHIERALCARKIYIRMQQKYCSCLRLHDVGVYIMSE